MAFVEVRALGIETNSEVRELTGIQSYQAKEFPRYADNPFLQASEQVPSEPVLPFRLGWTLEDLDLDVVYDPLLFNRFLFTDETPFKSHTVLAIAGAARAVGRHKVLPAGIYRRAFLSHVLDNGNEVLPYSNEVVLQRQKDVWQTVASLITVIEPQADPLQRPYVDPGFLSEAPQQSVGAAVRQVGILQHLTRAVLTDLGTFIAQAAS